MLTLPGYLVHIRKRGGYRKRFGTRFGRGMDIPVKRAGARRIWIQAVSLGEMLAIEPLLKALASDERIEIYLTVTTSTGYALALEKYSELAVGISYFPIDFYPFSSRVWDRIEPDIAICAETELWPEHTHQAVKRGIPFLLVNGRLSDRSFKRAMKLRGFFRTVLLNTAQVYACSELDRDRYVALGAPSERVVTTGNIKVDVAIEPVLDPVTCSSMRAEMGISDGFLLLGSSTWPGEEEMLIDAFRAVREHDDRARLMIVPRHAERRHEIEAMLRERASDLAFHFKSRGLPERELDILIADTHGELRALTQLADLAFIGKSLPPHTEGQTPVECGVLGKAMVFGSGMSNFRSIREGLLQYGAAREVSDEAEAIATILDLSQDPAKRGKMGEGGKAWHASCKGAVERTVKGVLSWLDR
ncbi:glycosyltransferase N-terminal domain-containing protein [Pelagicoccus sp. SDUM812002]|uniref:3-deoxy-D-manno-octulosonic acid transferase n=1 Tax=Pelagicoccus sp. SDUM812002 TaxID=3041266 RepID=UPI00280D338F|nr:glycosyltransferase N-terminal domain-containing protein [Pelagicoccus sp. SDUM812002]MDQ8188250.1 glycosyltransferase N-terminal domain-containing protein [Pelagicoccus sp. SDUM812002]